MSAVSLMGLALGLSLDALAVAIVSGAAIRRLRHRYALRVAASFGLFQALMPIAGWLAGQGMRTLIGAFDHWVVFGLLAGIGGKMVWESRRLKTAPVHDAEMGMGLLFMLSLATSLDAWVVGLSLSLLGDSIIQPAACIGAVTFAVSLAGMWIGNRGGHCFESAIELAGGLILVALGTKVLAAHLLAGPAL